MNFMQQAQIAVARAAVKARNAGVSPKRIAQASAAALATASTMALAEPPDFTTLTAAIDFSTAIVAILSVFGALVGVAIVWKGGSLILGALGFRR